MLNSLDLRVHKLLLPMRKERKRMLKNAIISFLLSAMLFMAEAYQGYFSIVLYISIVAVIFAFVCYVEYAIEQEMRKYRAWKKFKRTVNSKITLNQPTKAS
jgi:membrane-bound ClpP family serine protease